LFRLDRERRQMFRLGIDREPFSERVVYNVFESTPTLPSLTVEFGRYIVVERNRRPHRIMMLRGKHHDVKPA
jgi:hypothetical protein